MTMFEDQLEAQRESVRILEMKIAAEVKKCVTRCVNLAHHVPYRLNDGCDIAELLAYAFGYKMVFIKEDDDYKITLVPREEGDKLFWHDEIVEYLKEMKDDR